MLRHALFILLNGLAGTAVLLWLGTWQMQRLEWKRAILDDIEMRIAAAPVALPDSVSEEADEFLPVTSSGTVTADEIHVLVSQKHVGAGYRIIAAFETDTGRRIMVDRGFIKTEQKNATRRSGAAEVTGNLHWPDEITSSIPEPDLTAGIWFARDVPAMAAQLGTEPVLIVALQPLFENDKIEPLPVDTAGIPNDHLQYAITWFSLAAVWLAMTLAFLLRVMCAQKA